MCVWAVHVMRVIWDVVLPMTGHVWWDVCCLGCVLLMLGCVIHRIFVMLYGVLLRMLYL